MDWTPNLLSIAFVCYATMYWLNLFLKHWCLTKYKMGSFSMVVATFMYILWSVCLRLSQFSHFFHAVYGAVCIQLTHFSCDGCENMCTVSYYYHHQIGSMNHLPLFRVRSWNSGMRCMSFHVLILFNHVGGSFNLFKMPPPGMSE